MIRGDLLIYTKNGIKRLDYIFNNAELSPEIEIIEQKNIKNSFGKNFPRFRFNLVRIKFEDFTVFQ